MAGFNPLAPGSRAALESLDVITMTFDECVEYVQNNPLGFLATIDGPQPHVRPMTVWLADGSGIYFYTSRVKPLMSQLQINPNVEVAFNQPGTPPDIGTVLRISGRIEIVDDMEIRRSLYEAFPWLKTIGTGRPDSYCLEREFV